jgi:dolichol-phosphate mannosyltransferase
MKILIRYRTEIILNSMLNLQDNNVTANSQIFGSPTLSIILPTQHDNPAYQSPEDIKKIIPKGITFEIIVAHYDTDISRTTTDAFLKVLNNPDKEYDDTGYKFKDSVSHFEVKGSFISAILKGMQLSTGQFILVMDADFPYPKIITSKLIAELIKNPNSIIVASRYTKGASLQNLPFLRRLISKGARTIARHGLSITDVKDPLSRFFALPRQLVKSVEIEGKGNQLLLEILVKVRSNSINPIIITEIPFQQKFAYKFRKLELNQISEYLHAIWSLYRHDKDSKARSERVIKEQEKHRSIPFLSKTARFFTVGASGLALNYVVSFLLSNVISNLWYIQAAGIGIVISVHTNFMLNKIWTFEDRNLTLRHVIKQYFSFLALCAFGALIQLSLTYVFFEHWHIHYAISLMLAVTIASMSNFLLNKKITFGEKIWE